MGATPVLGLPWPPDTGVLPDVPYWLQQLAEAVEQKLPRGRVGYGIRTSQAGPVASGAGWVTVASLGATVTLATARKLKIEVAAQATSNLAGTVVGIRIRNATNGGTGGDQTVRIPVDNYGEPIGSVVYDSQPAGTYTYQVQLAWFSGPGSAYLTALPATIAVYDDGPA